MTRSKCIVLGIVGVLLMVVGVAFGVPSLRMKVLGMLNGETFYDGRPMSVWRHDLEQDDCAATRAQLKRGGKAAMPLLMEIARGGSDVTQTRAADLLAQLGENAVSALVKSLSKPEERPTALYVLGKIGPKAKAAVYSLTRWLGETKDETDKLTVLYVLQSIGPAADEAVPDLIDVLKTGNDKLQPATMLVLAKIGPAAHPSIPLLIAKLDAPITREPARMALAGIGSPSVPALVEVLRSAKPAEVRAAAARAVETIGPQAKAAVPALTACLQDSQAQLNLEACRALARIGPDAKDAVPNLIVLLPAKDNVSEAAKDALARIGPEAKSAVPALVAVFGSAAPIKAIGPAAIPELIALLAKKDQHATAAGFLTEFKDAAVGPAIEALRHEEPAVRVAVAQYLKPAVGEPAKTVPALCAVLNDNETQVRAAARDSVRQFGPAALPYLDQLLAGKDDALRLEAVRLVAYLGPKARSSSKRLLGAAKGENAVLALESVRALAAMGIRPKEAVPLLLDALKLGAQGDTIQALGHHGRSAKSAVPLLCQALEAKEPEIRWAAAQALGQIGLDQETSLAAIVRASSDRDSRVRAQAVEALGTNPQLADAVVPVLIERLRDEADAVRWQAMMSLGRQGSAARAAVPQLIKIAGESQDLSLALKHLNPRAASVIALGQIGPPARQAVPLLLGMLGENNEGWNSMALEALGLMQALEAAKLAAPLISKEHGPLAVTAALALWRIEKSPKALAFLQENVNDKELGPQCLHALGRIGRPAQGSTATLIAILSKETDPKRQASAADALGNIGPEGRKAIPALIAALRLPDVKLRIAAARALAKFEDDAADAVSRLLTLLDDPESPAVRHAAADALLRIDPEAAANAGIH